MDYVHYPLHVKGKIVETGSHDVLVDQKGLYYAMWRQQIGKRRTAVIA